MHTHREKNQLRVIRANKIWNLRKTCLNEKLINQWGLGRLVLKRHIQASQKVNNLEPKIKKVLLHYTHGRKIR